MSEPGFNPQPPTFEVNAWTLSQCRTNTDFLKTFSHKGLFFARTFLFIITLMGPLEMRDSYSKHLVSPSPWSVCEQFLRDTITQYTFYIIPNMATSKRKSTSLGDHEICNFWINLIYLFIWRFFSVNIWNFIFNLQHKLQKCYNCKCKYKKTKASIGYYTVRSFQILYLWWKISSQFKWKT